MPTCGKFDIYLHDKKDIVLQIYFTPDIVKIKFEQPAHIVFGLEVLDDGPIFSAIACCQEKGTFVCKH